jgi:energy-coupling factor transporter ATP-binding protein EcfA2
MRNDGLTWLLAASIAIAVLALLVAAFRVRAARHRKRYLRQIGAQHRDLDGAFALPLEHVFVGLRLIPLFRRAAPSGLAHSQAATAIWAYLWPDQVEQQGLSIVGPAGSGKTTLLKHIALTLAGDRRARQAVNAPDKLPVLLSLGDRAWDGSTTDAPSTHSLSQLACAQLARSGHRSPHAWLERQLHRGRCLVMLDGLDQLAGLGQRERAAVWVQAQMARYPGCRFLITARAPDDRCSPLRNTAVLEIRPLVSEQIEALVSRWYRAHKATGAPQVGEAAERSAALVRQIRLDPSLSALAARPLLLTLLAAVHRQGRTLPTRRAELYAAACDLFLDGEKGEPESGRSARMRSILQPLAYHMMQQGRTALALAEAAQVMPVPPAKAIEDSGGLLVEANDACRFVHPCIQSYLAAAHVEDTSLSSRLVVHVHDPWWHETIRLYAGQADATTIIRTCLKRDPSSTAALQLAVDCVREARSLSGETRQHFERELRERAEGDDPEQRRVAGRALLSLRLDRMLRLDGSRYADRELLTHAEYQVFLDESRLQHRFHQPDHWLDDRFPVGQGSAPVLGVRPSDVEAFCAWLTAYGPGKWHYRLPQPGELDLLDTPNVGYWVRSAAEDGAARVDIGPANVDQRLDQYVVLTLARDLSRAHGRDHDLVRAKTIALARASDLAPTPGRVSARASDLDRALSRVRDSDATLSRARDEALSSVIDRTIALGRARSRTLGLDLARVHTFATLGGQFLDHDLVSDLASAVDRAKDRTVDRAIDRILNSVASRDLARARTSASSLSRLSDDARDLLTVVDRARARAADSARIHTGGPHPVRDLARHLARELAHAGDLAHGLSRDLADRVDRALVRARDRARSSDLARTMDLSAAIDRAHNLALARIVELAGAGDFGVAADQATTLALDLDLARARTSDLVSSLPAAQEPGDVDVTGALADASTAVRDMALAFSLAGDLDADIAIAGALARACDQMPAISGDLADLARSWRWHVRLQTLALTVRLAYQSPGKGTQQMAEACLNLYVDMAILEGRIRGDLDACEGIRLMRERLPEVPPVA